MELEQVKRGELCFPISERNVDVTYINLQQGAEDSPYMFFFQAQVDPRIEGVLGLSLSEYIPETSGFKQASLYGSPQDGLIELFSVVHPAVYAIGIQTLDSTQSAFKASGLSQKIRDQMKSKLLHDPCITISYTYLVASAKKGDASGSPAMQGAMYFLNLIHQGFGAGLGRDKTMSEEMDTKLGENVCEHDELKISLPDGEEGFDLSFNLLVQTKPNDEI